MKLFTSSIIFLYLFALTSDQVVDWWPVRQYIDTIKPTGDEEYTKKTNSDLLHLFKPYLEYVEQCNIK